MNFHEQFLKLHLKSRLLYSPLSIIFMRMQLGTAAGALLSQVRSLSGAVSFWGHHIAFMLGSSRMPAVQ